MFVFKVIVVNFCCCFLCIIVLKLEDYSEIYRIHHNQFDDPLPFNHIYNIYIYQGY